MCQHGLSSYDFSKILCEIRVRLRNPCTREASRQSRETLNSSVHAGIPAELPAYQGLFYNPAQTQSCSARLTGVAATV